MTLADLSSFSFFVVRIAVPGFSPPVPPPVPLPLGAVAVGLAVLAGLLGRNLATTTPRPMTQMRQSRMKVFEAFMGWLV